MQALVRLHEMSRLGTTTVEIKSGYGLDTASELKILAVTAALAAEPCCEVFPTFLGAHAVPPPYARRGDAYSQLVIEEMLPAVVAWHQDSALAAKPLFCDVFCEPGAFDYAQTAAILTAARQLRPAAQAARRRIRLPRRRSPRRRTRRHLRGSPRRHTRPRSPAARRAHLPSPWCCPPSTSTSAAATSPTHAR